MPEGEKFGVPVLKGGWNLPLLVGIGLTDLSNIGGPVGPRHPGSVITGLFTSCAPDAVYVFYYCQRVAHTGLFRF